MVPLEQVVRMEETTAPQVISHFNLFRSASINGVGGAGRELRRGARRDGRMAETTLPEGMGYAWSGISLEETKAGRQSYLIFGLALLLVYLTLAAQYESLVLPFIVLLGVPVAVLGALAAQWSRGFANDVYCQVGLVMLVGLAAKNAILIVEFAEQLRDRGMTVMDAAIESARIRLRPILMTSLAFILGVLPSRRRDRCRTGGSAVGWNDSGGRHVRVDVPQPALHPGALCRGPVHPRAVWRRGTATCRRRHEPGLTAGPNRAEHPIAAWCPSYWIR